MIRRRVIHIEPKSPTTHRAQLAQITRGRDRHFAGRGRANRPDGYETFAACVLLFLLAAAACAVGALVNH